jgi:hypothetical protein
MQVYIPNVSATVLKDTLASVKNAIDVAIAKRGGRHAYASKHEALGIITEEYQELINAITLNDDVLVLTELMDVAVAATWALASYVSRERAKN